MAGKTILQHQVTGRSAISIVSYEVAHALNQRARRLGILAATRVFGQRMKVYGELMEHERGCSSSEGGGRRRRAGKTFHHSGVSARSFGRTCRFRSDQESSCEAFPANENVRAWCPLFLLLALPRQTSRNGPARTISGTRGFDWTSRSK